MKITKDINIITSSVEQLYTQLRNSVAEANSWTYGILHSQEIINLSFDHTIGNGLDNV